MDNHEKTLQSINKLDNDIRAYAKQIVPMLLPPGTEYQEQVKLEQLLFQLIALDVYNSKIKSTHKKFFEEVSQTGRNVNIYELRDDHPDMKALKFRYYLEKIAPDMSYREKTLKYSANPKYLGAWKDKESSINRSERLRREYAKRSYDRSSLKEFLNYSEDKAHVHSIFTLRDFFGNGGYMNMMNFNGPEYIQLQQIVGILRNNLTQKIFNVGAYRQYGKMYSPELFTEEDSIETDRLYSMACQTSENLIRSGSIYACKKALRSERQNKREQQLTESELKLLTRPIIDRFDKIFSALPTDERKHAEFLERAYEEISEQILHFPTTERTTKEQYKEIMRKTYEKYMLQLKTHTLPLRLSYFPEDKAIYSQMLSEARKEQIEEKKNGKAPISFENAVATSLCLALAACAGVLSIAEGNYILPAIEGVAIASAPIIHKICERHRLLDDVEKRLNIRNKRIIQVRGIKSPKQTHNSIKTTELGTSRVEQQEPISDIYRAKSVPISLYRPEIQNSQFNGRPVIYTEIPDNPYKPDEYKRESTRRRRVDKYTYNEYDEV